MKISKINTQINNIKKNTAKNSKNKTSFGCYHFLNGDENRYSNWLIEDVKLVNSLKENEFINYVYFHVTNFFNAYKERHPFLWILKKENINEESGQRFEDYCNVRKYLQNNDKCEEEYEGRVDSLKGDYSSTIAMKKRNPPPPPPEESENTFHYDRV